MATCFRNQLNILIPTLVKLKFFTFLVPTSQASETKANLAIRPKKIISNMSDLSPVINGKK